LQLVPKNLNRRFVDVVMGEKYVKILHVPCATDIKNTARPSRVEKKDRRCLKKLPAKLTTPGKTDNKSTNRNANGRSR
jgi:hypothetical protein